MSPKATPGWIRPPERPISGARIIHDREGVPRFRAPLLVGASGWAHLCGAAEPATQPAVQGASLAFVQGLHEVPLIGQGERSYLLIHRLTRLGEPQHGASSV